jgi:WD40 repeat protein
MRLHLGNNKYSVLVGFIIGILSIASFIIIPYFLPRVRFYSWCYKTDGAVFSVEISYDGSTYFAGTENGLFLFGKSKGTPIWEYTNIDHAHPVTLSADGRYMATVDWDNLHVFSRETNNQITQCLMLSSNRWHSVDFSLNGKFFVATHLYSVYLFSVNDFEPIWTYTTNETLMWNAQISADGSQIIAIDNDFLYSFSSSSNETIWKYPLQTWGGGAEIHISKNGEYIVYGEWGTQLHLFHKDNPIPIWITNLSRYIHSVDISYDGSYIIAGGSDGIIYFFSRLTSEPLWTYSTPWNIKSISISPNGMYCAAISAVAYLHFPEQPEPPPQGELYAFNALFRSLELHFDFNTYVYSCDISSDGKEILVGVSDGRICLFKTYF